MRAPPHRKSKSAAPVQLWTKESAGSQCTQCLELLFQINSEAPSRGSSCCILRNQHCSYSWNECSQHLSGVLMLSCKEKALLLQSTVMQIMNQALQEMLVCINMKIATVCSICDICSPHVKYVVPAQITLIWRLQHILGASTTATTMLSLLVFVCLTCMLLIASG